MVDHIRRSDTSVAGAFIYDNIPLRAPLLASEEEHEPIHRVDLLRRMLLHQQAGEEEKAHHAYLSPENRAFIALPAGAVGSKRKVRGYL